MQSHVNVVTSAVPSPVKEMHNNLERPKKNRSCKMNCLIMKYSLGISNKVGGHRAEDSGTLTAILYFNVNNNYSTVFGAVAL